MGATTGRKRLYEDGLFATASGRAKFVNTLYKAVAEPIDARFPFRLNTGRLRDQWHGMSRTGTVAQLFAHAAEPAIMMAQADMDRRLIANGDMVHVTSRRGSQIFPVQASDEIRAGQAFIAMHWGEEFVSGRGHAGGASHGVNALTLPVVDPSSKQPELKHAAIKILKAELPWRFVVCGWVDAEKVMQLQIALRPYLRKFSYASCTLFGRDRVGVFFRAADDYPASAELTAEIEALFGIAGAGILRYDDKQRGNARHILVRDGALSALSLAGDVAAERWLKEYLESAQPVAALGRLLLSPHATAPQNFVSRGRIVCNCLNIAEAQINAALDTLDGPAEARLAALQGQLKCGSNCGSCIPELKKLVSQHASKATTPA